jgi:hypothetical protein
MYKINANTEAIQALEKFVYQIAKKKVQDESANTPIQSRLNKETEDELVVE